MSAASASAGSSSPSLNASTASADLNASQFNFGGAATITAAGDITTDAGISIKTNNDLTFNPNQSAGAAGLKITGDFDIVATTSNDTVTIAGNIIGVDDTSNEDITIVAGASSGTDGGTITLGGTVGTEIRAVTLTAGTAINLGGNITTR